MKFYYSLQMCTHYYTQYVTYKLLTWHFLLVVCLVVAIIISYIYILAWDRWRASVLFVDSATTFTSDSVSISVAALGVTLLEELFLFTDCERRRVISIFYYLQIRDVFIDNPLL